MGKNETLVYFFLLKIYQQGFPGGSVVENPLPVQDTRVRSLIQEDPTRCRAAKPMSHNCWAHTREPCSHSTEPMCPRARALQQRKPLQWEACTQRLESSLRSCEDSAQPKIYIYIYIYIYTSRLINRNWEEIFIYKNIMEKKWFNWLITILSHLINYS